MSRDYQGPYYSLDDLRSVIDAMCKSLESSGQIDEHEHPSAYSTLLDTAKWMADARPAPAEPVNARLLDALKRAKSALVSFKFVPGCANCWEESDEEDLAAIDSAIAAAEAQQERLLQDMHDAGREIDRVMAVDAETVDRAWARFCGSFGDGPDAPYPGMIAAFETHYGQSFRDKEWRTEAACWAAAWHKATELATKTNPQAKGD
jgi:hypothetical protein